MGSSYRHGQLIAAFDNRKMESEEGFIDLNTKIKM